MKKRRRGAELEDALLDAAWMELSEFGYTGFTMDGVAARAKTSRPVISRRWSEKADLSIAAIRRQKAQNPIDVPDRGDVRTELLEYLELASRHVTEISAVFTLFSSEYFKETQSTPQDLRIALIAGGKNTFEAILNRAIERGEIDPEKLAPPIATLLPDLLRHHAVMTFSPPPLSLRTAWVDLIFLPLVTTD